MGFMYKLSTRKFEHKIVEKNGNETVFFLCLIELCSFVEHCLISPGLSTVERKRLSAIRWLLLQPDQGVPPA